MIHIPSGEFWHNNNRIGTFFDARTAIDEQGNLLGPWGRITFTLSGEVSLVNACLAALKDVPISSTNRLSFGRPSNPVSVRVFGGVCDSHGIRVFAGGYVRVANVTMFGRIENAIPRLLFIT